MPGSGTSRPRRARLPSAAVQVEPDDVADLGLQLRSVENLNVSRRHGFIPQRRHPAPPWHPDTQLAANTASTNVSRQLVRRLQRGSQIAASSTTLGRPDRDASSKPSNPLPGTDLATASRSTRHPQTARDPRQTFPVNDHQNHSRTKRHPRPNRRRTRPGHQRRTITIIQRSTAAERPIKHSPAPITQCKVTNDARHSPPQKITVAVTALGPKFQRLCEIPHVGDPRSWRGESLHQRQPFMS